MPDLIVSLRPLFEPRHVAVIGASRTPGKRGHTVTRNLMRCGFRGRITPINPATVEVEGLACYGSIGELIEPVDCAFIALPAEQAIEAVRQCGLAGVPAVIVGSNGFGETGTEEGAEREAKLFTIVQSYGMRLLGPNTNGIFNSNGRLSLGYNHSHGEPMPAGAISIASHSGAMFDGIAGRLRKSGVGLSKFVPVGNEVDVNILDFFEYFIADRDTRVIGLVIESLASGARFRSLCERAAAAGKTVVALKIGRSAAGASATLAHSSRLAGRARAYDALFESCGVACVRTVEGLVGSCTLLVARKGPPEPEDRRIICITSSGAGGAVVADFCDTYKLPLAGDRFGDWEEPVAAALKPLPTIARLRNPVDTGSLGNWQMLSGILSRLGAAGHKGPVLVYAHNMPERRLEDTLAVALAERRKQVTAPVIILAPGGLSEPMEMTHRRNGITIFYDIATCFESLAAYDFVINRRLTDERFAVTESPRRPAELRRLLIDLVSRAKRSNVLTELESADVLRMTGIRFVESRLVHTSEVAVGVAERIGFPVVLKALVPGVAHKYDRGLVVTRINSPAGIRSAYLTLETQIASHRYSRAETKIVLQPMLPAVAELIIGVTQERNLGYFLVVGLGGVLAEVIDRITLIPMPTNTKAMRARIDATQIGAMLARIDATGSILNQLIAALEALQLLVMNYESLIESIDVNPLVVTDTACVAVDALIVLKPTATAQ
jgi:acyl-CoA synthetase (NDP forming)